MITLFALPTADYPAFIPIPAPEAADAALTLALVVLLKNTFPVAERTFCQPREPRLSDLIRLRESFP